MWLLFFTCRKYLFDPVPDDPNYNPLPDERPGGFEWGQGQRVANDDGREEEANRQQGEWYGNSTMFMCYQNNHVITLSSLLYCDACVSQ